MLHSENQQGWGPQASDKGNAHAKTVVAKGFLSGIQAQCEIEKKHLRTESHLPLHGRQEQQSPVFDSVLVAVHWLRLAGYTVDREDRGNVV